MSYNVLIVEDSASMRSFIISSLEEIDRFQFFEVSNGFDALKLLPRVKFDLIITDINMPDINGLELANFIKKDKRYRHIPIIIVTTEQNPEIQKKGAALGTECYITKPFTPELIQRVVMEQLKMKG